MTIEEIPHTVRPSIKRGRCKEGIFRTKVSWCYILPSVKVDMKDSPTKEANESNLIGSIKLAPFSSVEKFWYAAYDGHRPS